MLSVGLGQSLVFTSIPILARENGLNEVQVSIVFGMSAFAWFFTSPLWGRYSDKFGTRLIAIIGSLGYSTNMILIVIPIILFENGYLASWALFPMLVASRLIYGLFGSATRPALFGYAGKISSSKNRSIVFSNLESGFILGTVLGPLIGALLFRYTNTEIPFILFGVIGFIVAIQLNIRLRNTKEGKASNEKAKKLHVGDPRVWPFIFVSSLFSITQAIIFQTMGFFIYDQLGYSANDAAIYVSICFGIWSVSVVLTQTFINPLFKSLKVMMVLGPILSAISFITLIFSDEIFALVGTLVLNGIGLGITRPSYNSALSLSHEKKFQSSAAGIMGSTLPIGHMIAPVFVSLYLINFSYVYIFSTIICIVSIAFTLLHPYILKSNAYK
tara:strand:+ start:3557 stop:4714 length:1158 start_codon:yes stop_codon:yes gene_type:complete